MSGPPAPDDGLREVRLLRFPLAIYLSAQQHADELVREMTLISHSRSTHASERELPGRLVSLVEELGHRYAGVATEAEQQRDAAIDRGDTEIDLVYRVPAEAAESLRHVVEVFDAADEYCRAGQHLLTLASPPEALAFRRWYLSEFLAQIDGAEPTPWDLWVRSSATS